MISHRVMFQVIKRHLWVVLSTIIVCGFIGFSVYADDKKLGKTMELENLITQAEPVIVRPVNEAEELNELGLFHFEKGSYKKAITVLQRALKIGETSYGTDGPELVKILLNLASSQNQVGNYRDAESLYKRAQSILETHETNEKVLSRVLHGLAQLYDLTGQYDKALPLHQQALSINQKLAGKESIEAAISLSDMARHYSEIGNNTQAKKLEEQALKIKQELAKARNELKDQQAQFLKREIAHSLNTLGLIYQSEDDYVKAEEYFHLALKAIKDALGPKHLEVAQDLDNLGGLYLKKGDYERAVKYRTQAVKMANEVAPEHPQQAVFLGNLGDTLQTISLFDEAEKHYKRALEINVNVFGKENSNISANLEGLTRIYSKRGDYALAEKVQNQALGINEKVFGKESPKTALTLHNLALVQRTQGNYIQAVENYQRAYAINSKVAGMKSLSAGNNLFGLAVALLGKGDIDQVGKVLEQANQIQEQYFGHNLIAGSEKQKRAYLLSQLGKTYIALTLLSKAKLSDDPEAAHSAMTLVLQRKGRILDTMAKNTERLRHNLDTDNLVLFDQLSALQSEYATLAIKLQNNKQHLDRNDEQQVAQYLAELEEKSHQIESKLSKRSFELCNLIEPVTLERVQQSIPKKSALVEFFKYTPFNLKPKNWEDEWESDRYIALVLLPQGDPHWINLKPEAADINNLIEELRRLLGNHSKEEDLKEVARELDEIIMRPIREKLPSDVHMVLLSPDGALNLVPFNVLVDENERYLIERYEFNYLASGRDLIRLQSPAPAQQSELISSDCLKPIVQLNRPFVLANPDYGSITGLAQQAQPSSKTQHSSDLTSMNFNPLHDTDDEAKAVKKIFPETQVLCCGRATEGELKRIHSPQFLLLATHGRFLPDLERIPQGETDNNPFNSIKENPLLRSFLAFAGANHLDDSEGEDGVLTALEAASLNLSGTKVAVLSACETGVGEIQVGEGIYGLRRAFVLAGAESQVMSLWQIPSNATKDLITNYFQQLADNKGRSEALRLAQCKMLGDKQRSHPYFWAGLIPSGQWTNLEGK